MATVSVTSLALANDSLELDSQGRDIAPDVWLFYGSLCTTTAAAAAAYDEASVPVFIKIPPTAKECRAEAAILKLLEARAPVPPVLALQPVGDNQLALVMPLYEPLPDDDVGWGWLLRQLFAALVQVHEAGVIHCDIKPRHLMVQRLADGSHSLVLCDFGLSVVVAAAVAGERRKWPEGWRGTEGYMAAPEVKNNDQFTFAAADIFSVRARRCVSWRGSGIAWTSLASAAS